MPTQDLDLSVFNAEYKNMKKVRRKLSTCCTNLTVFV